MPARTQGLRRLRPKAAGLLGYDTGGTDATTSDSYVGTTATVTAVTGTDVVVEFSGVWNNLTVGAGGWLAVSVDGGAEQGDQNWTSSHTSNTLDDFTFHHRITGLTPGAHTFLMRMKRSGGAGTFTIVSTRLLIWAAEAIR